MKRQVRQRAVTVAELRLARTQADLHASTAILRARLERRGPSALLGAGVATGAVAGLLPLGGVMRIARALTNVGLFLLRVPLGLWSGASGAHDRTPPAESTR